MSKAKLNEVQLSDLPEELIILIAEAGKDNCHAVHMERTCKWLHDIIRRKLTRLNATFPSEFRWARWFAIYKSLVSTDRKIGVDNETIGVIADRKFTHITFGIYGDLLPENRKRLKRMIIGATECKLIVRYSTPRIAAGPLFIDGVLYCNRGNGWTIDFMLGVYSSRIKKIVSTNDDATREILSCSAKKLDKLRVEVFEPAGVQTTGMLTQLCARLNITEINTTQLSIVLSNDSVRTRLKKVTDIEVVNWNLLKPYSDDLKTIQFNCIQGIMPKAEGADHIIIKYLEDDYTVNGLVSTRPIHLQRNLGYKFVENAHFTLLKYSDCKVTYIYKNVSVDNVGSRDVIVANLKKFRDLLLKAIVDMYDQIVAL